MGQTRNNKTSGLPFRDATHDFDHASSELKFKGSDTRRPVVTVAIPTYKRPGLLLEAVRSVLAQRYNRPLEIIVVDNDPGSIGAETLLAAEPSLRDIDFRYFVNDANIGLFPNWTRCLVLARGEWFTLLNDDDLLDPDFLETMMATVAAGDEIDGLVCGKKILDQRAQINTAVGREILDDLFEKKMSPGVFVDYLRKGKNGRAKLTQRFVNRLNLLVNFRGKAYRRLRPDLFFWGTIMGNPVGLVMRTRCALDLGGFYGEEHPSADHHFYVRFSGRYNLFERRGSFATTRIAENESAKRETGLAGLVNAYDIQKMMAGHEVPRWWLMFSPLVLAYHSADFRDFWKVEIPKAELEEVLALRGIRERPLLLNAIRFVLRGF